MLPVLPLGGSMLTTVGRWFWSKKCRYKVGTPPDPVINDGVKWGPYKWPKVIGYPGNSSPCFMGVSSPPFSPPWYKCDLPIHAKKHLRFSGELLTSTENSYSTSDHVASLCGFFRGEFFRISPKGRVWVFPQAKPTKKRKKKKWMKLMKGHNTPSYSIFYKISGFTT